METDTSLIDNNKEGPQGVLALRTMSMPADANPNGNVFGGWIMAQMDSAGAMMAYEMCQGKVVTIAVDGFVFRKPIIVGDVVCIYGRCIYIGHTSVKLHLELWTKRNCDAVNSRVKVTETGVTYVAVDDNGKKKPLPQYLIDNKEEIIKNGYIR